MSWQDIIKPNDVVDTPHGSGKVRRVSENKDTVQVDIGGHLFEVPGVDVYKAEDKKYKDGMEFKEGDRVRDVDGKEGKVSKATQRSVYVQWDDSSSERMSRNNANIDLQKLDSPVFHEEKDEPKKEPTKKEQEKQADETADSMYGLFNLKQKLEQKIEDSVDGELKELRDEVKKNQLLEVKLGDKKHIVEGMRHYQLEQLIKYCALRLSPLLVGMAGTGKTHAAEQVSEALSLPFYSMSVGAQTSKSDIIGYMNANGKYVGTHFRDAYEKGGIFLMDEIDAGNANVLIQVNAALSNGVCAFPDAMVKKHKDFVFIASANTYGNGANRQYVGRNQLDAATLDRFAIVDWKIDEDLEKRLSFGVYAEAWHKAVRAARDYVAEKNIRALISPRATQKGCALLDTGQQVDEVITATITASVPEDKKEDITKVVTKVFESKASGVKGIDDKKMPIADLVKEDGVFSDVPF